MVGRCEYSNHVNLLCAKASYYFPCKKHAGGSFWNRLGPLPLFSFFSACPGRENRGLNACRSDFGRNKTLKKMTV